MTGTPITWNRALRALLVAFALLGALIFVAANFVLVDIRLLGLNFETRLAWAVVVSAALGFAGGMQYGRLRSSDRVAETEQRRDAAHDRQSPSPATPPSV